MSTSNCAPRHVWTKVEEGALVECLMELVSMGGWKSDNGTFRPGYLAQLVCTMAEKLPKRQGKENIINITQRSRSRILLNKPFPYYDELTYVFGRDRATGRFAETFADVGSNEPGVKGIIVQGVVESQCDISAFSYASVPRPKISICTIGGT
ncbi:retrotransposon protein [Cucumis melo var. makuwa]|uniref:Retrotransposon protein n=1 Tax=Cucumis melo var. makuwa TaxID=1194695 RepID=A0A5D3BDT0_CUCMM|nr:retrotransposon protein [Cucumis melo var. makuwa]